MTEDVLERAMDFDECKEPSPARKAEIEEQLAINKETFEIAKKRFIGEGQFADNPTLQTFDYAT